MLNRINEIKNEIKHPISGEMIPIISGLASSEEQRGQAGRVISERDQQEIDYYTQLYEQLRDSGIDTNVVVHKLPGEDLKTYYEIEDKIRKKVYGEDE